jgi:SAM-dependent methyltransferase
LAAHALTAARRLALPNARFLQGDARTLPLPDASVDGVFCYDVVTNFPTFDDYSGLIDEMLRIVKPGGRVLVGSVPDRAVQAGYEARVLQFAAELERLAGPPLAGPPAPSPSFLERVLTRFGAKRETPPASISCYYFDRSDFEAFAAKLGVGLTITDIHPLNPYAGYRFNAIFQRAN